MRVILRGFAFILVASFGGAFSPTLSSSPEAMTIPYRDGALPARWVALAAIQGKPVPPPAGFVAFCVREPSQCASGPPQAPIRLDAQTWTMLETVNDRVNNATVRKTDKDNHGIHEHWAIIRNSHGDCDDMAVTKRALLYKDGLPLFDLRLAVVLTPRDQRHAVLTVITDRGDLVLDSLNSAILPWQDTSYTWVARQDGSALGWVALNARQNWWMFGRGCPLYHRSYG